MKAIITVIDDDENVVIYNQLITPAYEYFDTDNIHFSVKVARFSFGVKQLVNSKLVFKEYNYPYHLKGREERNGSSN